LEPETKMDHAYALEYRNLYERHWWWRSREEFILKQLTHYLQGESNNILDVGCGDGLFFNRLQRFGNVTGVEADPATMSMDGPWRNRIHCRPFDASFRPHQNYEAILMLDVLEHLPDASGALAHVNTLLSDRGFIIATVPAFNSLWTSHDDLNHHVIRYTKKTFFPLFKENGLRIIESKYLFHWTCPVKLMIRAKEMLFGSTPKTRQVASPLLNSILLALTQLEQATVSRWNMPFGSSLMVIAERA
jgi:2-polyprenyl-3-methyl-5-hydroxy-6-metoxy-1,4-benzoquinol methylase